ncbi:neuronal acetylcholine receptor subunit alpha-10 [Elysia marginata]|uniref:Neuronal acetylcholine receptor subunit alpha-10 n=1 Tax=Elysia marginata TaxID=1093978 RepID=A0AAV4H6L6_9GAST|nr:neuronal acetylcholine receptor subunit alpha-10 [Elysia marginata]
MYVHCSNTLSTETSQIKSSSSLSSSSSSSSSSSLSAKLDGGGDHSPPFLSILSTGIYLTVTMGMTSMSIILTVFVLQLHHVGPHKRPVPGWLHTVVVGVFARLVCMSRDSQPFRQHRLASSPDRSRHSIAMRIESDSETLTSVDLDQRGIHCIEGSHSLHYTTEDHNRGRKNDEGRYSCQFGLDERREDTNYVGEAIYSNRVSINALGLPSGRPNCNGDGFTQQVAPSPNTRRPSHTCYSPLIQHSKRTLVPPPSRARSLSPASCPLHSDHGQEILQTSPKPRLSFMHAGLMPQAGCLEGPALERYQQLVMEWQFVAHVMDRLLFWLFLALAMICSMSILVIKPLFKPEL